MPLKDLSELKAWRNKYGISQESFARIADLGVNTVAKIETGETHLQGQTTAKVFKAIEDYENDPANQAVATDLDEPESSKFDIAELRTWRNKYGLSQEKFAQLADLGVNTIAKIETSSANVMPATAIKIRKIIKKVESGEIAIKRVDNAVDHMAGFNPQELKAWRKKHGISQENLAILAHLGVNTILKLESGSRVEKETLLAVMKAVREVNQSYRATTQPEQPAESPGKSPQPEQPVESPGKSPQPEQPAESHSKSPAVPTESPKSTEKPVAKITAKSKSAPVGKTGETGNILSDTFDLKSWRKKFGFSQGKLAALAQLSLNTVMKFESGAKDVQKRTLERLVAAIKRIEGDNAPAPVEAPPVAKSEPEPAPAPASAVIVAPLVEKPVIPVAPQPEPAVAKVSFAQPASPVTPLQLTNLDLELINRVILMSTKNKLRMLSLMMEEEN